MSNPTTSKPATGALSVTYGGEPVRVDADRIHPDMRVPDLTDRYTDEPPGRIAASLFFDAQLHGALVAPDGITIECYADDDADGGGFAVVAYDQQNLRRGVTCGWRDVDNIARRSQHDPRAADNRDLVRDALEFFAAELNCALGVQTERW